MYNYFLVLPFGSSQVKNGIIWINLVLGLLLPHHTRETSYRVSHRIPQISSRLNRSCKSHEPTCRIHARRRRRTVRTLPPRTQPPLQKRLHLSFHDLCRPHAENDEPLHPLGPPTLSTHILTLIGRCTGPKYWVSYAICALHYCWAHSLKPQVLLPLHS